MYTLTVFRRSREAKNDAKSSPRSVHPALIALRITAFSANVTMLWNLLKSALSESRSQPVNVY